MVVLQIGSFYLLTLIEVGDYGAPIYDNHELCSSIFHNIYYLAVNFESYDTHFSGIAAIADNVILGSHANF